jgi:integrase
MLFDWLVTGHVVGTNPAHAVRGPKHVVKTGKTTVQSGEQARELLDSIDVTTLVGLRDRALIPVMTFAFARIGAVVAMRVEDYYANGKRWWVRLYEKGGKRHEMPAHHNLGAHLDAYMKAAGVGDDGKAPLFRSARPSSMIADALGRDGKAAEGLSIIDEALARSERNEERWCVAELLRIKGELILREGGLPAATAAEEHFLSSLDWSRRQGAPFMRGANIYKSCTLAS